MPPCLLARTSSARFSEQGDAPGRVCRGIGILGWRSALRNSRDMHPVVDADTKTKVEGTVLSKNFEGAN